MDRNIQRMADFARKHQVRWRPHAKMHKSAELALLLQQAGAQGVCVQKGVRGRSPGRWRRAGHHHHQRSDCHAQAAPRGAAGHAPGQPGRPPGRGGGQRGGHRPRLAETMAQSGSDAGMDVLVEIDVGQGRCGVPPGEAAVPLHWPCRATPGCALPGCRPTMAAPSTCPAAPPEPSPLRARQITRANSLRPPGLPCPGHRLRHRHPGEQKAASGVFGELRRPVPVHGRRLRPQRTRPGPARV